MSTEVISISDESSAWDYVKQAIEGSYDNEVIELDFNSWPSFHINIKGDRYSGTLPSSLMKSLVELQTHLNRVYAEVVYGKSARSLTHEERESLEIIFKVEEGSSNVVADLSGFFTELGKNAMDKMTGTQVVTTVLGAAALWGMASTYQAYLGSTQKTTEEENRHEITIKLLQQQPRLLEIQNEQYALYTNILKSVPDAKKVTLGDTVLEKADLEAITKSERQATELKRIDDEYQITSLKIRPDSYRIEILRISDGRSFPTELFKGHLSMSEMGSITKSFFNESSIQLNVVARIRGDVITSANIVGVNNQANGDKIEDETSKALPKT